MLNLETIQRFVFLCFVFQKANKSRDLLHSAHMEAKNYSLSEYFGIKQSLGLHLANCHILATMLFLYCLLA